MVVRPKASSDCDAPRPLFAWKPVVAIVATVAVTHAAVATRYGWHRDEFYYVATGRRLAWGYVDQPPLTPVLARLAAAVSGGVLPLRVAAIAVQCGVIAIGALIARECGGGRRAQTLAAGCMAGCAVFVGASLFLGTTPVDQLFWALIIWCVLYSVRVGSVRSWAWTGVAAGLGLEDKHTVAVLLAGMLIGLAVCRREVLRGRGPWMAAGIAAAIWAPNLLWDARHHWETLDMARVLADKQGGIAGAFGQLPLLLLLFPGPLIVFVLIRGVRWPLRDGPGRAYSWLILTAVLVVAAFTVAGGKPYYSAPLFVPLFAFGCVATEQDASDPSRPSRTTPLLIAASAVFAASLSLPYFPPTVASALRSVSQEPMETYGWPDFARQVAHAEAADPDAVAVYVSNYGEAGALAKYGRAAGLVRPVVTGQNAYRDWGPPGGTPTNVIAVGEFDRSFLLESWATVTPLRAITLPRGLKNEETENEATIFVCTGPRGTWKQLWPKLSYLS